MLLVIIEEAYAVPDELEARSRDGINLTYTLALPQTSASDGKVKLTYLYDGKCQYCFTPDNRLYGMKSYQTYEFKKE